MPCNQKFSPYLHENFHRNLPRVLNLCEKYKESIVFNTGHLAGQHEALGTYSLVGWLLIRLKERETAAKAEIEKQGDRESQCDKQGELGLERERDKLTYPSIGCYLQGHTQMDRQTWLQGFQGTETDRQRGMVARVAKVARYRDR